MRVVDLPTPSLVLDRRRLERNLHRMQQRMEARGVGLRPHLKTAKSADIAARARDLGARGITVSTLREARYFLDAGFTDILYQPVDQVRFQQSARIGMMMAARTA